MIPRSSPRILFRRFCTVRRLHPHIQAASFTATSSKNKRRIKKASCSRILPSPSRSFSRHISFTTPSSSPLHSNPAVLQSLPVSVSLSRLHTPYFRFFFFLVPFPPPGLIPFQIDFSRYFHQRTVSHSQNITFPFLWFSPSHACAPALCILRTAREMSFETAGTVTSSSSAIWPCVFCCR